MSRIIKYRLESANGNELEFKVKKHTQSISEVVSEGMVDEFGNPIMPSKIIGHNTEIKEGLSATSFPSGEEANVIILQTDEGYTEEGKKELLGEQVPDSLPKNITIKNSDFENPINLSKFNNQ